MLKLVCHCRKFSESQSGASGIKRLEIISYFQKKKVLLKHLSSSLSKIVVPSASFSVLGGCSLSGASLHQNLCLPIPYLFSATKPVQIGVWEYPIKDNEKKPLQISLHCQ